jgi:hypothetical protein
MVFFTGAQDWCRKRKPVHPEKPAGLFDDKLISDRFNHCITPSIVQTGYTQIESAIVLRNEIPVNGHWTNDPNDYTYNVYGNVLLKHAFSNNIEYHISVTDFIVKGGDTIRDLGSDNFNTCFSFGTKYCIYCSNTRSTIITIFGQLTFPKPRYTFSTFLTPEVRLLYSHMIGKHLGLTYNTGLAYNPFIEKMIWLYAINPKLLIGKRLEMFSEFYKNFTKTGPLRTPLKRGLFGIGFYLLENLYFYSSIEAGWYHEESLNSERFDLGLTYRFL